MCGLFLATVMYIFSSNCINNVAADTGTEKISIPIIYSFKSVMIYGDFSAYITEGVDSRIIVSKEEANDLKFKVDNGVLVIRRKKPLFGGNYHLKIIIVVKEVRCISVMDDSEVRTVGILDYLNLKLEIYGDGAIYAHTKANEVNTLIKGLGKIEVQGNFKNAIVDKDAFGNMVTKYN
jgi:hypothetical protein